MKRYSVILNQDAQEMVITKAFTIKGAMAKAYKMLRLLNPSLEMWTDIMDNKTGELMIRMCR